MAQFKKLTIVDDNQLNRLIEKQIRQYDPALKILSAVRRNMDATLERDDILPEEKLALYNNAQLRFEKIMPSVGKSTKPNNELENHLSFAQKAPPPISEQRIAEADKPQHSDEQLQMASHEEDEEESIPKKEGETREKDLPFSSLFQLPNFAVDEKHHGKLEQLISLIKLNPSIISADSSNGAIILNGEQVKGSSYQDLIHSLYHQSKNHNLIGRSKFINALNDLNKTRPKVLVQKLIHKADYISNLNSLSVDSSSHETSSLQTGKGLSNCNFCSPPGKRIKLLKCY